MHTCIHACIHTYIHTYTHTQTDGEKEIWMDGQAGMLVDRKCTNR